MGWFLIDLAAALCIAGLSGMGVGSGGLLVIYLTLFCGAPQLAAQGWNLLFYLFSAGSSLAVHLRRRQLPWGLIAALAGAGIIGAYAGSSMALRIDPTLLRRLFGGMLVLSGVVVLRRRGGQKTEGNPILLYKTARAGKTITSHHRNPKRRRNHGE